MKLTGFCFVFLGFLQTTTAQTTAPGCVPGGLLLPFYRTAAFFRAPLPQNPSESNLLRILLNRSLWGKDFGRSLSGIPAWDRVGEPTIVVFNDRLMGHTAHETRKEAEGAAADLAKAMAAPPPQASASARDLLGAASEARFRPTVMPYADDSLHVYLVDSAVQLLSPDLTPASLEEQLGKPERVTKHVIEGKGDRRGLVLTLFSYASGQIVFAEADVSARPGKIDRVFLDVPAVMLAAFQEAK